MDTQDNTALVEQMLREATGANEPGSMAVNKILDGNKSLPLAVTELKSAGYVRIYDTLTGVESIINRNMLPVKLKQTRADGSFVFSLKQTVKPVRGTFKCLLHESNPDRALYDRLGFAVCKKDNLTSQFQVERHMIKRHQQEWATIKAERERKERAEDRELQRMLLTKAAGGIIPTAAEKPQETAVRAEKTFSVELSEPVPSVTTNAVKTVAQKKKGDCPYCGKQNVDGRHTSSCSKRPE